MTERGRHLIAASAYAVISMVLAMLDIRLELALGLPFAIIGAYLFWLHFLQKRDSRAWPERSGFDPHVQSVPNPTGTANRSKG
jgi:hypothetical protein